MKKGIIVLLITVLAAGFAFADFSGGAYIQFNADLENKNYGLANGTYVDFTFKIDSEVVKVTGENPVHVEVEASANLIAAPTADADALDDGLILWDSREDGYGIGLVFNIKKAAIVGDNWSVGILGAQYSYDYAKASSFKVKTKKVKDSFGFVSYLTNQPASYSVAYNRVDGITVSYDGFTGSFGFDHKDATGTAFSATMQTKEFSFSDDMVKVQIAAEASKKANAKTNVGASAKASVAVEDVNVSAAADFGFEGVGSDAVKFAFDAALAASYNFIDATAYVFKGEKLDTYDELYLEATAKADLNAFEVPVTVSLAAKNLIDKSDKGIALSASAEYAKDAITAGASFGMNVKDKSWNTNAYGKYDAEAYTVGANVCVTSAKKIAVGAFAETSAIIEGATFGLNYGLNNTNAMYYGGHYCTSNANNSNDFGADTAKLGTVGAYCIIAF